MILNDNYLLRNINHKAGTLLVKINKLLSNTVDFCKNKVLINNNTTISKPHSTNCISEGIF